MRKVLLLITLTLLLLATIAQGEEKNFNRLIHEKSPYLLQHTENPIWWYSWGEEAFRAAREQNKPIFLSIGYASCHWCHVMEGDSFSKEEVAKLLNENFIAIKVDREERPDVDQIYMGILQAMRGSGGWPASLFLTPNRVPFMAATFIPREEFMGLLTSISSAWETDQLKIQRIGKKITNWMLQKEATGFSEVSLPDDSIFRTYYLHSQLTFDTEYGGFGQKMKFPRPMQLSLLLRIHRRSGSTEALKVVTETLDAMARGGLYDQLGGGFHRYSTDRQWQVPHFEKMLYSNALLINTYLEAYQVTKNPEYAQIAKQSLDYILRDMTDVLGGFYSSEDADSEKTEGKFYVWSEEELRSILTPQEFSRIKAVYHVTKFGNFNTEKHIQALEKRAGMKSVNLVNIFLMEKGAALPTEKDELLQRARKKLMQVRANRVHPLRDDKTIVAWNGLMISAMSKGYQVLKDPRYLLAAQKSAHFILKQVQKSDGTLFRRWREGEAQHNAVLNDYAYFVQGLINLYQSDFNSRWYYEAMRLQEVQNQLFWDTKSGGYYFSDDSDPTLLKRIKSYADTALPDGNAVSALNLLQLADLSLQWKMRKKASRIISNVGVAINSQPTTFSQMLIALDYLSDRSKEVALIGPIQGLKTQEALRVLRDMFLPNQVVTASLPQPKNNKKAQILPLIVGKPMLQKEATIYVCEKNICKLPIHELSKMKGLVTQKNKISL